MPTVQLCLAAAREGDIDLGPLVGEVASGTASPDEAADRLIEQLVRKGR